MPNLWKPDTKIVARWTSVSRTTSKNLYGNLVGCPSQIMSNLCGNLFRCPSQIMPNLCGKLVRYPETCRSAGDRACSFRFPNFLGGRVEEIVGASKGKAEEGGGEGRREDPGGERAEKSELRKTNLK